MKTRILVVNDTQEILELFREILVEQGYEVILHSFTIQDMNEIQKLDPDLIILDYIFGAESMGWQMLQKLKMRRATASIPVIICTAAVREVREIQGYLLTKNVAVVPKPFEIDDLLQTVEEMLRIQGDTSSRLADQ